MRITIFLAATLMAARAVQAYDNVRVHPALNTLALERCIARLRSDPSRPEFASYDFAPPQVGWATFRVRLEPVPESLDDSSRTFFEWLAEGGRTADLNYGENFEIALRHFYDPAAVNPPGDGVPWLTDLVEEDVSILKTGEANPHVTAKEWALGNVGDPNRESRHSLPRYHDAMVAFLATGRRSYAALAWLCLGEVLHLLADMTVPAHVRNDGHPGTPGTYTDLMEKWRSDPYENEVLASVVQALKDGQAPSPVLRSLNEASTPGQLFDIVATYTNENFVSQDTISGTAPDGTTITNRNGLAPYPSPKVVLTHHRDGLFKTTDAMGDLLLAEVSWRFRPKVHVTNRTRIGPAPVADMPPARTEISTREGYDLGDQYASLQLVVTHRCVSSQAARLVPVSIAAQARLIEIVLPGLSLRLTGVNLEKHRVEGRVSAIRNAITPRRIHLYFVLNGTFNERDSEVAVRPDGSFEIPIPPSVRNSLPDPSRPFRMALAMDLGGILVNSNSFDVIPVAATPTPKSTGPEIVPEPESSTRVLESPPPPSSGDAGTTEDSFDATGALAAWIADFEAKANHSGKDGSCTYAYRLQWTCRPFIRNGEVLGAYEKYISRRYDDGRVIDPYVEVTFGDAANPSKFLTVNELRSLYPGFIRRGTTGGGAPDSPTPRGVDAGRALESWKAEFERPRQGRESSYSYTTRIEWTHPPYLKDGVVYGAFKRLCSKTYDDGRFVDFYPELEMYDADHPGVLTTLPEAQSIRTDPPEEDPDE